MLKSKDLLRRPAVILSLAAALILVPIGQALAATHIAQRGESLFTIGKTYGITAQTIKSANNLKSDTIMPGQKLTVPDANAYTVKKGDTLFSIAKKYGIPAVELQKANGLQGANIMPGQVLRIPAGSPARASRGGSVGNISNSDFELLARLVKAEADSESHLAKVAVAAVVLNRVQSDKFPNTIAGVIYQRDGGRYQFEPVLNGWINKPANEASRKAVREAVNGRDPTNGALYFFEHWVPNKFLQARPVSTKLDAFTFTY
ncbi:MAG: LysM peptidoglycan-binding domain-containing protein [Bacillota bacterium]|jgi:spore germination cell wall hydrolase CwlJ-like protein